MIRARTLLGSDLAVRYALEHPRSEVAAVGIAGWGPQCDATWSTEYEAGTGSQPRVEIDWASEVHASLGASFTEWIHRCMSSFLGSLPTAPCRCGLSPQAERSIDNSWPASMRIAGVTLSGDGRDQTGRA